MEIKGILAETLKRENELEEHIQKIERKEEEKWRIRLRILWIETRDKKTKYFHSQHKERIRRNTILDIENGNIIHLSSVQQIMEEAFKHLQASY